MGWAMRSIAVAGMLAAAWAARAEPAPAEPEVFARVGTQVISLREFESARAAGLRQKFYHGRPPEGEVERFSREVGETLVTQALLVAEAERRGIEPDQAKIDRQVAEFDHRLEGDEQWRKSRERILPRAIGEMQRRSRLERLEASVRAVPAPTEDEARAYHAANPKLFTEPEQLRFSLILVKLDPAASPEAVAAATAEARRIRDEIGKGADFAALARAHSADPSAPAGGDLGYVHRGMLPEAIERQFADSLPEGSVSEPTRLLEGMAIVRLDARKAPRLRDFGDVAATARDLLQRERGEAAWTALKSSLRAQATVWFDESRFSAAAPR